jgi:hypothetical protein
MPAVTNTSGNLMCTLSFSVFCSYWHTNRLRNTLNVLVCRLMLEALTADAQQTLMSKG